jgi:hypothetical protein
LSTRAFQARVRAELQAFVRALAGADYEEAARWVLLDPDAPDFETLLAPFLAEHEQVAFDPGARRADRTVLRRVAPLRWTVQHVLPDPSGENSGYLEGEIDLREVADPNAPLVRLLAIHA